MTTFINAIGLHMIKDLIESDGSYTSFISIEGKSNFTSITTENRNTAVLIQESFIDSVSTFNSYITLVGLAFSSIKSGPSLFIIFNEISSSSSSV